MANEDLYKQLTSSIENNNRKDYLSDPYGFSLSMEEKKNRIQNKLKDKTMNLSGYSKANVLEVTDGDGLILTDDTGAVVEGRLTSDIDPYLDAVETSHLDREGNVVQPTSLIEKSRYKSSLQPEMVSRILGKPKEELTDIDYLTVAENNKEALGNAVLDGDNQEGSIYYKVKGTDYYGRPLLDIVNEKTGNSISRQIASSPEDNANFDYKTIMDSIYKLDNTEPKDTKYDPELEQFLDNNLKEYNKMVSSRLGDGSTWLGEDIDLAQSSGIQMLSNMAESLVRLEAMREDQIKGEKGKPEPYIGRGMQQYTKTKDTRTPEQKQLDLIAEFKDNKNKTDAVVKAVTGYKLDELQDQQVTDQITGVMYETRLDHIHKTLQAKELIKTGNPVDVAKGIGILAMNVDRYLAESAPSIGVLATGYAGVGAFTLGQVNEIADNYKENTGKEMSSEDYAEAFLTRLPITVMEQMLTMGVGKLALGKKSVLNAFKSPGKGVVSSLKNTSKIVGAGMLTEYLQETAEGIHTQYYSEAEGDRNLTEAFSNFDNHFGGIVGAISAGVPTGAATVSNKLLAPMSTFINSDKRTEKQKNKAINAFREATSKVTYTDTPVDTETDNDLKATITALTDIDVENMSTEEAIKMYVDVSGLRDKSISSISANTNDLTAQKLAMLRTKAYSGMSKEDVDSIYRNEPDPEQAKKDDFEEVLYRLSDSIKEAVQNKVNNKPVEDKDIESIASQILSVADKLDVDNDYIRKSMAEVDYEATYGIAGYKTYNKILKTLNARKADTLNLDEIADIDNQIASVNSKLNRFLSSQTSKLAELSSGLKTLVRDDTTLENRVKVKYSTKDKPFTIYAGNIVSGNYDTGEGFYGVSNRIMKNIDGIISVLNNSSLPVSDEQVSLAVDTISEIDSTVARIKSMRKKDVKGTLQERTVLGEVKPTTDTKVKQEVPVKAPKSKSETTSTKPTTKPAVKDKVPDKQPVQKPKEVKQKQQVAKPTKPESKVTTKPTAFKVGNKNVDLGVGFKGDIVVTKPDSFFDKMSKVGGLKIVPHMAEANVIKNPINDTAKTKELMTRIMQIMKSWSKGNTVEFNKIKNNPKYWNKALSLAYIDTFKEANKDNIKDFIVIGREEVAEVDTVPINTLFEGNTLSVPTDEVNKVTNLYSAKTGKDKLQYKGVSLYRIDSLASLSNADKQEFRELGGRYNRVKNVIFLNSDDKFFEEMFRRKAWRTPKVEGVHPFKIDFKTYNDFKLFILEHEYRHSVLPRNEGETTPEYENRINSKALEALGLDPTVVLDTKNKAIGDYDATVNITITTKADIDTKIKTIKDSILDNEGKATSKQKEELKALVDQKKELNDKLIEHLDEQYSSTSEANNLIEGNTDSKTIFIDNKTGNRIYIEDIVAPRVKPSLFSVFGTMSSIGNKLSSRLLDNINYKELPNSINRVNRFTADNTTEDPARALMFNADGSVNNTAVSAVALSAEDFLINSYSLLTPTVNKDIAAVLGKTPEALTTEDRKFVKENGVFLNHIADSMGKKALQIMGLTYKDMSTKNKDYPGVNTKYLYQKLVAHLGNAAIQHLMVNGHLKINDVVASDMKKVVPSYGSDFTLISVGNTKKGKTGITNDGKVVYTPNKGSDGKDTVYYTYTNASGKATTKKISIFIRNGVAGTDQLSTVNKNVLTVDVFSANVPKGRTVSLSNKKITLKYVTDNRVQHNSFMDAVLPSYSYDRKPHANKLKDIKKLPNTSIRNSLGIFKVPSKIKDVLFERRNRAFIADSELVSYVLKNRDMVKKYLGYKEVIPDNILFEDKLSIEGKNRAIEDRLQAIEDFYYSGLEDIYFDWFMSKNHRLFIDSNTINPMEDTQLHRFLFSIKDNKVTINLNKDSKNYKRHLEGYSTALCQAFGFDIEKIKVADRVRLGKALMRIKPEDMWKLIEDSDGSLHKIEEVLNPLVVSLMRTKDKSLPVEAEIESFGHLLTGIRSLEAMKASDNKVFDTDLKVEFDSKTNGFAIRQLQFPTSDIVDVWGEKVGFFKRIVKDPKGKETKLKAKDIKKVYTDYALERNILDAYETLASTVKPDDFIVGKIKYLTKVRPDVKQMYSSTWNSVRPLLPTSEDGIVTKELRKLVKNPFMVFNYGSKESSIKKKVSDDIGKTLIRKLIASDRTKLKDLTNEQKQLLTLGKELDIARVYQGMLVVSTELHTKPLSEIHVEGVKSNPTIEQVLNTVIGETYGNAVWNTMEENFSEYLELNSKITDAFKLMTRQFKKEYFTARSELLKKGTLTETLDKNLIKTMLDKFPAIKTALSDSMESSLGVFELERMYDYGSNTASKFVDENGKRVNRNITPIMETFGEAVSAGAVLPIHMLDGTTVFKLLMDKDFEKKSMLTIHDAVLVNPLQLYSVPKKFNSYLYTSNHDYSVLTALTESFKNTFDGNEDVNTDELTNVDSNLKPVNTLPLEQYEDTTIDAVIQDLEATEKAVQKDKDSFYTKDYVIANIAGGKESYLETASINSAYKKSKQGKTDKAVQELINDTKFYSDPVNGNTEQERTTKLKEYAKGSFASLDTRLEVLNILESMGTTIEPEHKKILVQLLTRLDDKDFKDLSVKIFKGKGTYGTADIKTKDVEVTVGMDKEYNNPAVIYMHELVHAIAGTILNNATAYKADLEVTKLRELYNIASKEVTPEDFLPDFDYIDDKKVALEKATVRYDYIFNNPNIARSEGLQEFLAYSLTNPSLVNKLKSIDRYKGKKDNKSIFQRLLDLGFKMIDLFLGTVKFSEINSNLQDSIENTFYQIVRANEKSIFSIGSMNMAIEGAIEGFYTLLTKGDEAVKKAANKLIGLVDKNVSADIRKEDPTNMDYVKFLVKAIPLSIMSKKYREVIPDIFRSFGLKHTGLIQNLYNELRDSDNLQDAVEQLGLLVEKIDQSAMKERSLVVNMLAKEFGQLTDIEDKALAEVGLETDLSSLYGTYTAEDIDNIVSSDEVLESTIQEHIETIKSKTEDTPELLTYYSKQAEGLGYYMITGKGTEIQNPNAYNIVSGRLYKNEPIEASEEMVNLVDRLATLYAIKFSDMANRELYSKLDVGAKDMFLKFHQSYKRDTMEGILKGQDIHAIKGYTKYLGDNYADIKIGTKDQEAEFKKQLYKPVHETKYNPITGKKIVIYSSRLKTTQEYDKGAFSLFSVNRMGTSLIKSANVGEELGTDYNSIERMRNQLDGIRRRKLKKLINDGEYDYTKTSGYMPVLGLDGKVLDYRIVMGNDLKKELLGYDVSGLRALGNMHATNIVKEHSKVVNKQTLDTMFADMEENYIPDSMKGKNQKFYTIVSPNSHDPKIREYYKILPDDIKAEIKRRKKGKLAVREDLLLQYFGVRDMSMVDMPGIRNMSPKVRQVIKVIEEGLKSVVPIYKSGIILKTLSVPLGNVVSNINMSVMYKTNIVKVMNMYRKNFKYLKDYLKTESEVLEIEKKVKINTATKTEIASLNRKRESLIHSPIAPLMEMGMYQMIVEDLSQSEQSSNNRLLKAIDEKTSFIPQFVKTATKWVYLSEGTPIYEQMARLTQFSDFVAKATEYQVRVEKGVDKNKALSEALRMVVNYSRPSSSIENYVNKMGLWMFTKFGKRIQWVLTEGIQKNPISATLALFMQNVMLGTENIGEQQFMLKSWSANWYTPLDILEGAIIQPHMEWVVDKVTN